MTRRLPRTLSALTAALLLTGMGAAANTVTLQQDRINMNGGSITNFFATPCSGQSVVDGINADGTYSCTTNVPTNDVYVNETGDTMTGTLAMTGDNITGLPDPILTSSPATLGFTDTTYVDESGDAMSGNLDMLGHELLNVDSIGNGTSAIAVTSTIAMQGNTVQNPGSITSYFGSACGAGEAVQDVSDSGGFTCISLSSGDAGVDYAALVNRSGGATNAMTGTLDVGGNLLDNVRAMNMQNPLTDGNISDAITISSSGAVDSAAIDSSIAGTHLDYTSGVLDVQEGSGSGLDADTLDGVELANINWGDVAMAQTDIDVTDVSPADGNLDMNGNNVTNAWSNSFRLPVGQDAY